MFITWTFHILSNVEKITTHGNIHCIFKLTSVLLYIFRSNSFIFKFRPFYAMKTKLYIKKYQPFRDFNLNKSDMVSIRSTYATTRPDLTRLTLRKFNISFLNFECI